MPPAIAEIAAQNKAVVYGLLFRTVAETLRTIAADPATSAPSSASFAVLHTWGQTLVHHPHLHCVIPGGGLASDGSGWVACRPGFLLPVRVLSRYFRRVLLAALEDAFESEQLRFAGRLQTLSDRRRFAEHLRPARETEWVVYAKRPFAGPEAAVSQPPQAAGALMRTETSHEAREDQRKSPIGRCRQKYRRPPAPPPLLTTPLTDPIASCLAAAGETDWAVNEEAAPLVVCPLGWLREQHKKQCNKVCYRPLSQPTSRTITGLFAGGGDILRQGSSR